MRTWTVDDVMTKAVVSVEETATYRAVVDLLVDRRFSKALASSTWSTRFASTTTTGPFSPPVSPTASPESRAFFTAEPAEE